MTRLATSGRRGQCEVAQRCQEGVGLQLPDRPISPAEAAALFVLSLPEPQGPAENLALNAALLDYVVRTVTRSMLGGGSGWRVDDRALSVLRRCPRVAPVWNESIAATWQQVVALLLEAVNQECAAERAAILMHECYREPWTLEALSSAVNRDASRLADEFRARFGISTKEYLARVRVSRAMEHVTTGEKIDAIPLAVGYRSRKNLNAAFVRLAGCSPSTVRQLPATAQTAIRDEVEAKLWRPISAPGRRAVRRS